MKPSILASASLLDWKGRVSSLAKGVFESWLLMQKPIVSGGKITFQSVFIKASALLHLKKPEISEADCGWPLGLGRLMRCKPA
jgi:hypothetical protein